jgi:hypothetical protein
VTSSSPEQLARQNIDALLEQCGWIVQSCEEMNLGAERGNAVWEDSPFSESVAKSN